MKIAVREIGSKTLHRKARNRRYYKKKQLSQIEQNLAGLASNFEEMKIVKDKQFIPDIPRFFKKHQLLKVYIVKINKRKKNKVKKNLRILTKAVIILVIIQKKISRINMITKGQNIYTEIVN